VAAGTAAFPVAQARQDAPLPDPADFSPEEEKVYAVVSLEPQSIDELSQRAALASSRVVCALLSLELKDAVRQAPGQRYHRSI